ncbi:Sugar phosphate permease [Tsukamurella pulmonis]|uniref:Putative proline/betaine transporter n=1 Tax=Tsukamurella pulmonis TaxID=47312 RepID=A0A1H1DNR9_9ACTN|nr:Sugar phosphate permease [Tsukamurella pulmonis]SUP21867.1 Proline porter II [Tsukamurella pulmonis]
MSTPPKQVDKGTLRKAISASALGNMTEWYDYGVYAATATYITAAFFPGDGLGKIGTMLGFAVSFLLRPLGGVVWGPLGDKLGRKAIMATTILLMAGATALIGALPTHAMVGGLAPVLLILLRVVQGFSTGGEYGGAATFMAEYSPDKKRGFFGSFLEFGTMCGFVLGSAVVLFLEVLLTDEQMSSWGWRIPFFVALPLGLVGWYLREQMHDSPVFNEMQNSDVVKENAWQRALKYLRRDPKILYVTIGSTALVAVAIAIAGLLVPGIRLGMSAPVFVAIVVAVAVAVMLLVGFNYALFYDYWRPILTMVAMVIALNVANYTLLTYMPTYLKTTIGLAPSSATALMLIGQLVMAMCIPLFGALSDRTGRKPLWIVSLLGMFLLAWPLYSLMGKGFGIAIVAFVILGLLYIPQLATISATFPAMFPTHVRFAGFALSYNVATAAFGGTAPLVNEAVIESTGWNLFPAWYMMGACVIGLLAMPFLKETARCSIRGTEIPGPHTDATRLSEIEDARLAKAG